MFFFLSGFYINIWIVIDSDFHLATELPSNSHVKVSVPGELHCYTREDDL